MIFTIFDRCTIYCISIALNMFSSVLVRLCCYCICLLNYYLKYIYFCFFNSNLRIFLVTYYFFWAVWYPLKYEIPASSLSCQKRVSSFASASDPHDTSHSPRYLMLIKFLVGKREVELVVTYDSLKALKTLQVHQTLPLVWSCRNPSAHGRFECSKQVDYL